MSQASSQRGLDDRRSQQSITERSINFMQQRQATNSIASASRRKAQGELFSADKIFAAQESKPNGTTEDAPYFQRRMQRARQGRHSNSIVEAMKRTDPLNEAARSGENHEHLNQFLKDQIQSRRSGRSGRSAGKPGSAMSERNSQLGNALAGIASSTRRPSSKQIAGKMVQMSNY